MRVTRIINLLSSVISIIRYFSGESALPLLIIKRGQESIIEPTATFRYPEHIIVGKNTLVNHCCMLWAGKKSKITLGNDVLLGPGVKMFSVNHSFQKNRKIRLQKWIEKDINIGNDVWIGADTVVISGVHISDGCVVGAGSVVSHSLTKKGVYGGVPAKFIKSRD